MSEAMWNEIRLLSPESEQPKIDERDLADAGNFISEWFRDSFERSAVLFFLQFAAFLLSREEGAPDRKGLFCISGVPYVGKSTLVRLMQKCLRVHRLPALREDFEKQLVYAGDKDLIVLDDADKVALDILERARTVLDGEKLVASKKFQHESEFEPKPIFVTTNNELMHLEVGSYFNLKTRGFHWYGKKAMDVRPTVLQKGALECMFALLLYKAMTGGEAEVEECLRHAVAFDGRVYGEGEPNEVHELLELSKKAKYSYMLLSAEVRVCVIFIFYTVFKTLVLCFVFVVFYSQNRRCGEQSGGLG